MRFTKIFFALFIGLMVLPSAFADRGHRIEITVEGLQDTTVYLAYHYGNRQYLQDTILSSPGGNFVFEGETPLDPGMYMVVLPGQKYFEILVDKNQHFAIKTTMDDYVNSMRFENSPDNEAFYDYMRFLRSMGEQSAPLRNEMQNPETTPARKEQISQEMDQLDKQVRAKQEQIIEQFPDGLFSLILKAQQEPPLPEVPTLPDGSTDHERMYQVFKKIFWENIDFSDDRLLRTPVFHVKLDQYFNRVLMQIPDSIIAEADRIVEKSRAHPEVFKYTVNFITNAFERSQIMGMDEVFVHMVEEYYMTGEAHWVTKDQLSKIIERVVAIKPLLIGNVAPNITMFTPDSKPISLHATDAKYTVVYFWDSECGHCKKQTPKLKEFYQRMNENGVEIFAVNTEADRNKWLNYIEKNELPWINVSDPSNQSGFRDKYDIWATPLLFLLDQDKRIMAKRITVEQLEEIITRELEQGN